MNAELEKWMGVWEKAMEAGIFPETPKPDAINAQQHSTDYFGNVVKEKEEVTLNECDTKYWNTVYQLSKGGYRAPDVTKVTEQTSKIDGVDSEEPIASQPQKKVRDTPTKDDLGQKGAELGNTANPVEPPSRGEDQRKHVTPDWSDGKGIRELVSMKNDLYELEVKLNKHPKFGSYGPEDAGIKKIQTQIDELRHKIDELSNSLSPDFVQDELS